MAQTSILHPDLYPRIEDGDTLIGRLGKRYRPSEGLLAAVNVALLLERPLLLTSQGVVKQTLHGQRQMLWALF